MISPPSEEQVRQENTELRERLALLEAELAATRQHERELSDFVENAVIALRQVDAEGAILWANQAELDLLGYAAGEYIGHSIREFQADPEVIEDILQRLAAGEAVRNREVRLRCKDGSIRHAMLSSNARWKDGKMVHTRCFTRDFTERRRIETQLLENEQSARAEAETLNRLGRFLSAELDLHKLLQAVTDAGTKLTGAHFGSFFHNVQDESGGYMLFTTSGIPREDFENLLMPRVTALFAPTFHGEGITRIDDVRSAPHHGMPAGHMPVTSYLAARVISRSGEVIGALLFGHPDAGVFTEREERIVSGIAAQAAVAVDNARLFDSVQRERARAEDSEDRLRLAIESADLGTWDFNPIAGELNWSERCKELFGLPPEAPVDYEIFLSRVHPEDRRRADEAVQRALDPAGDGKFEIEYRSLWPGGAVKCILAKGHAFFLEKNGVRQAARFIGTVMDITERKQFEEQLRQTAKLESLGVLAGGVAHDFNNLLTGILGNSSLALETLTPSSPARPMIEEVVAASERAASLTHQLLAYSGKGRFIIQKTDLSELIRDITFLIQSMISKTVVLRLELASNLPPIEADVGQIQQLVMNLVINGAEAIGDRNGVVTVISGVQDVDEHYLQTALAAGEIRPGRYAYFEVRDDGCGMDEATQAKIFDPFFTTKFTGRGLGLAAALGIVRGHGGTLKVYSTPGAGTTFKVLLPVAAGKAFQRAAEAFQDFSGRGTILVVDDEEVVRRTAKMTLERYGYDVIVAENGKAALEIFQEIAGQVSLVLLDMTMPLMSGEETLRHLKEIRPDISVILSSGFNEVEAIRRFSGEGLAGFLQKPYTAANLAEKVKAAAAGS